ncbi:unnamed protein product [Effrenium voratum]|uniref:TNFR-Cys domain-containing protein n=1 Tax=Effrenium voratum TaxID=2562239 RepID=A0AA36MGA0_9DINO|nr:unnamed protein product [Effrenium voratum]
MASALTTVCLEDELAAMPAPWRDRVQHHARRFHEKDATTVLNRYELQRRIMSRPQLEKHAFHVASWLVLPEVRRSHGDSVEALLSRYLESLDGQPLCERLKAVLSLVAASSGVAGLSGLLGKGQKRKAEMMRAEEPEKPDSSKPVDACGEKAVRLMQKASQTWQNYPSECPEVYVDSLEQEMQEVDGAKNWAKLRMVLRRAVAALSPPRRLGDGCEGKMPASTASNEQSLATKLQSRLRKIVLRCLDRVDLADLRLAPVQQCLQARLQTFQELVASESRIACKKQWARLQAKCASTLPPEAASLGVAGLSGLPGKGQKRRAEMMRAEEPEKPDSAKPVDACSEKAVRLMQKASQTWQNHPSECREAYVESLEQEMQEADGAENSAKLRMVLRRAVAALSPPRRLGDGCEGKMPASTAPNDQATLATNLQSRLRKIVLRCLDRVDLADLRLAPVQQCLQARLQTFQELVTGESRIACKKQWARLQCPEVYVDSLEQEMQEVDGAKNWAKLRMVLRRAVAALSPPRRLGDGCEGKMPASTAPNDQATLATNLQSRLRKIVLRCLDRVDLADLRLAPVQQCLQARLQTFQELVTGESRIACKKQWARLQARFASTVPTEAAASLSACAKGAEDGAGIVEPESSASCPHGKLRRSCSQCAGCPHGKWAYNCPQCSVCPHGKVKRNCVQCSACPHDRLKQNCLECSACPHGKVRRHCLQCTGCPHGKVKIRCLQCSPCPHGKIKRNCVQCSPCPHGKLKRSCRMCAEARGKVNCTQFGVPLFRCCKIIG